MARFNNCAEYFEWDDSDKLFELRTSLVVAAGKILWDAAKQSTVSRIVALLKARFGSENEAERFRAELRNRMRTKGEPLHKLYQDVCCLISLAYPGELSAESDIVGRDAFLEALDEQALRVRILKKQSKNLDDALNLARRLESFDIMGSMSPEAEKSKSKFVRAADGSKEYTGSGDSKMSKELLKQLADLKGLVCCYRRGLEKQQQEIEVLKRSYESPYQGNWNLPPEPRPTGAAWPGASNSFPEPSSA